ncbi:MAG: methylated-DNA--[protein]-cysteine S-methyltransferase [Christensenellaceae bacterium]|jgi:methylated-DNA-[protein]-cysteine S-methyltransferase
MYYTTTYDSPLGLLTFAADDENLIGLWIEGQKYHGAALLEEMLEKKDLPIFDATKKWLERYFAGKNPLPNEIPLAPAGSAFRQDVWEMLLEIPYGNLTTYGEIGRKVAQKMNRESMSAQAIGGAVGHNPISIIIPCHRVVGRDGSLTGYAGGIDIKTKLLEIEGVLMEGLFIPKKGTAL